MAPALHHRASGAGPRLVLVHGFTQTGACWDPVVADLAADHEVVTVDLPGHGGSGPLRADLPDSAALVGEAGGRAVYVGYSLGGRVALHLALDRPELVEALVLVGATAGLRSEPERVARRAADEARADRVEAIGVTAFLDEWLAQPLFAGLDADHDCRAARSTNTAAGLAASLRLAGTGTQADLWPRLGDLAMPVLLVTGEADAKFTALAVEMTEAIESAEHVVVPAAGHSVPFEQPAAFAAVVRGWTGSLPRR